LEIKLDRKTAKIVCFGEDITGRKVTNPKYVLVSSPDEEAGFRDILFL
jgi:hypothetical protein